MPKYVIAESHGKLLSFVKLNVAVLQGKVPLPFFPAMPETP